MTAAYEAFAYAYDQALGNRFFEAARELLDWALENDPPSVRTHLDLACGTGRVVEYFRKRGFFSMGVDASLAMLGQARRHGPVAACDFRVLSLRKKFSWITCFYDSLNHLLEFDELTATFRAVAAVMDQESRFVFDMNHPRAYPEVWGAREPFVSAGRDHYLRMATTFSRLRKRGRASITGWALRGGEKVPIDEIHEQRSYSEREIERALRESGLRRLEMRYFDPFSPAGVFVREPVKFLFIVKKASSRSSSIGSR